MKTVAPITSVQGKLARRPCTLRTSSELVHSPIVTLTAIVTAPSHARTRLTTSSRFAPLLFPIPRGQFSSRKYYFLISSYFYFCWGRVTFVTYQIVSCFMFHLFSSITISCGNWKINPSESALTKNQEKKHKNKEPSPPRHQIQSQVEIVRCASINLFLQQFFHSRNTLL